MDWLTIKLISAFLLPPLNFLLLGIAGFVLLKRRPRWGKRLVGIALGLLWLFSMPITGSALGLMLEKEAAVAVTLPTRAQAIVVLGGGIYFGVPDYADGTVGKHTLERLRYAAVLQRRSGLPILVSGGDLQNRGISEAEIMQRVLEQDFRVPVRWAETRSHDTIQNALYSKRILDANRIKTILLVTHGWHMPRARRLFEQGGFEVITAATGFNTMDRVVVLDFLPNAEGLEDSRIFFHEVMGMLWAALH